MHASIHPCMHATTKQPTMWPPSPELNLSHTKMYSNSYADHCTGQLVHTHPTLCPLGGTAYTGDYAKLDKNKAGCSASTRITEADECKAAGVAVGKLHAQPSPRP